MARAKENRFSRATGAKIGKRPPMPDCAAMRHIAWAAGSAHRVVAATLKGGVTT